MDSANLSSYIEIGKKQKTQMFYLLGHLGDRVTSMFCGRDVDCWSVAVTTVSCQQSAAALSWSAGYPCRTGCCALLSTDRTIPATNTLHKELLTSVTLLFSN